MSKYSLFGECFFFNDTATTEIYTLSLHDALPISVAFAAPTSASTMERNITRPSAELRADSTARSGWGDRKSTRLNSSHVRISYAVFCLIKKSDDHDRHDEIYKRLRLITVQCRDTC